MNIFYSIYEECLLRIRTELELAAYYFQKTLAAKKEHAINMLLLKSKHTSKSKVNHLIFSHLTRYR